MGKQIDDMMQAMGMSPTNGETTQEEFDMMKAIFEATMSTSEADEATEYFDKMGFGYLDEDYLEKTKGMSNPILSLHEEIIAGKEKYCFLIKEKLAPITGNELRIPVLGNNQEEAIGFSISSYQYNLDSGYDLPILLIEDTDVATQHHIALYVCGKYSVEITDSQNILSQHTFDSFEEAALFASTQ